MLELDDAYGRRLALSCAQTAGIAGINQPFAC